MEMPLFVRGRGNTLNEFVNLLYRFHNGGVSQYPVSQRTGGFGARHPQQHSSRVVEDQHS